MEFPVELKRDLQGTGLILKVSSLPIFSEVSIIVPQDQIQKLGFFDLTYEYHYNIQEMETELERIGKKNVNAYRPIRTKKISLEKPYKRMQTTTFQSYHIPEELVKGEREKCIELALSCTS